MSVLTIRAHSRYAMRTPVRLRTGRAKAASGLLIEISQTGARISNLGSHAFDCGQQVDLTLPCGKKMAGTVRWSRSGIAGIALDCALHTHELAELLAASREDLAQDRYGT